MCCVILRNTSGSASNWPVTRLRQRRWPTRSARRRADRCGPNKRRSSRSAIPICPVIVAVDDAVSRNSARTPAPDSTTTFAPSVSRPGMALGINATHRSAGGRLLDHPERRPAVRVCHSRPRCCRSVTYLSISAADRCECLGRHRFWLPELRCETPRWGWGNRAAAFRVRDRRPVGAAPIAVVAFPGAP
jgi:hypothetical protein